MILYSRKTIWRYKMKELLKVMKAASDPTRVKILKMLGKKVMCVCEIQTALGTAQSTASKHLKILEDAGLVISKKDGLWVNYLVSDGRQSPFAANLLGNMRHWLDDEPEISTLLEKIDQVDRCEILNRN
jgi:ArsR family transcriptional regulator